MRGTLAFVLGFTFVAMLTQAGCIPKAYPQFHAEQTQVQAAPKQYVPVPTTPKPQVKPQTWKDTAKQIGRSGIVMIGVNVILTTFRFGMAAIGLPVF